MQASRAIEARYRALVLQTAGGMKGHISNPSGGAISPSTRIAREGLRPFGSRIRSIGFLRDYNVTDQLHVVSDYHVDTSEHHQIATGTLHRRLYERRTAMLRYQLILGMLRYQLISGNAAYQPSKETSGSCALHSQVHNYNK